MVFENIYIYIHTKLASRQSGNTAGEGGRERRGSDMSFYLKKKGREKEKRKTHPRLARLDPRSWASDN